jgi:hypothetical protein
MKKFIIILIIVLVIVAGALYGYFYYVKSRAPKDILTFEDCANAGNLVVNTNPRECHTKKGQLYIEEDNHVALADYIEVTSPKPYDVVSSPFKVEGKAKGIWYGNNRLTIKLVDQNQRVIMEKSVFALSDVSNDAMVPFVAAVDFHAANLTRGQLLIEKVSLVNIPGKNGPLIIPVKF